MKLELLLLAACISQTTDAALMPTKEAVSDTTFIYLSDGGVDAYPTDLTTTEELTDGGWKVSWADGTDVNYTPEQILQVSNEGPTLPRLTTFKVNNKYNDQVFTDVEAYIGNDSVRLQIGCIGKWLTPSFQLSDVQAQVYVDGELQQSMVSRNSFNTNVVYTVGLPNMNILRRRKLPKADNETIEPLKLTADQLSTNAPSNYDEGLDKMIDGNTATFFHSTWGDGAYQKLPEDSCPHIDIHLREPLRYVQWTMTTRASADRMPRKLELYASTDGKAWHLVETYTTADGLPTTPGSTYSAPTADLGADCSYLRLRQCLASYKNYFCVAELKISKVVPKDNDDSQDYTYAMEPYGRDYVISVEWLTDQAANVPIVNIETTNGQMISSKIDYLDAQITIDGGGVFPSMKPTPVHIKGRGNTSWSSNQWDKNPYRLKFDEKVKPFGLTKGKSWVLLANKQKGSMMANAIGMKAACLAQTAAANHIVPIELYINGQYRGNYNFTEKVGFSNNSIDLDDESDAVLLELDTYYDETYKFKSNPYSLPVNIKEPDLSVATTKLTLSDIQTDFNKAMRQLSNKGDIAAVFDLKQLARYLLVCDLIENYELMHPKSVYLYKEQVKGGGKYIFGPIWDLDWAFGYQQHHTYFVSEQESDYYNREWMEARQFVRDLRYVSSQLDKIYYKEWTRFMNGALDELLDFCTDYYTYARPSLENNYKKWNDGNDYATRSKNARSWLQQRAAYIYRNLNIYDLTDEEQDPSTGITDLPAEDPQQEVTPSGLADVYTLHGQCVKRHVPINELRQGLTPGIYIVNGKKMIIR